MAKNRATFQIEWPDDYEPGWMNVWNLMACLTAKCPNTKFTVTGSLGDGSPVTIDGGPRSRYSEGEGDAYTDWPPRIRLIADRLSLPVDAVGAAIHWGHESFERIEEHCHNPKHGPVGPQGLDRLQE